MVLRKNAPKNRNIHKFVWFISSICKINQFIWCRQSQKEPRRKYFCNLCFGIKWNWALSALSQYFYDLSMNLRHSLDTSCTKSNASWQPDFDIMQHCCVALIQTICAQIPDQHFHYPFSFSVLLWANAHKLCSTSSFYMVHIQCLAFSSFRTILRAICCCTQHVLFNHQMWIGSIRFFRYLKLYFSCCNFKIKNVPSFYLKIKKNMFLFKLQRIIKCHIKTAKLCRRFAIFDIQCWECF